MNDGDIDRLLERTLGNGRPSQVFHDRVLRDSTAAFLHVRRDYTPWRLPALSVAAVLLAGVSFLLGRCSVAPAVREAPRDLAAAGASGTVTVPGELVAWLDAARLFRQLGMEDRMARAVDRASWLLPRDAILADESGQTFAAGGPLEDRSTPAEPSGLHLSGEILNRILAQSFGE